MSVGMTAWVVRLEAFRDIHENGARYFRFGLVCRRSALGENLIQAARPVSGASRAGRDDRMWVDF